MAYENQIKCTRCGKSIPPMPEDASPEELLCDWCHNHSGVWSVDEEWPLEDWQYEVANNDTRLGYWDWVNAKREEQEQESTEVIDSYERGGCPDCNEEIPVDVKDGDACDNCGHVFYKEDKDEK